MYTLCKDILLLGYHARHFNLSGSSIPHIIDPPEDDDTAGAELLKHDLLNGL